MKKFNIFGLLILVAFVGSFALTNKAEALGTNNPLFTPVSTVATNMATPASSCQRESFARDLTIGSTGNDVIALQSFLMSKGLLAIPAGSSLGYFGPATQTALAVYQASKGVAPVSGYFGPATRAVINTECQPVVAVNSLKGSPFVLGASVGPVPTLAGISTSGAGGGITVTFTGTGFEQMYTVVTFTGNGVNRNVSPNSISADGRSLSVVIPYDLSQGTYVVGVTNLDSGVPSQNTYYFSVLARGTTYTCPAGFVCAAAPLVPTSPTVSCYNYLTDLSLGSYGPDVTALQNFLVTKGYLAPLTAASFPGYFGASTQSALSGFQTAVGISPNNGYFGPITRAMVISLTCQNGQVQSGGSIQIISPNGGQNFIAGGHYTVNYTMPSDKIYQVLLVLVPQTGTSIRHTDGTYYDSQSGGYDIGGETLNYTTSNISEDFYMPADIYDGSYKLRVYLATPSFVGSPTPTNTIAYDDSDSAFNVSSGYLPSTVSYALASTPTIQTTGTDASGNSTGLTATFSLNVTAQATTVAKPVASDFPITFYTTTGSVVPASVNVVTIPNTDIASSTTSSVTVTAQAQASAIPASGLYNAAIGNVITNVVSGAPALTSQNFDLTQLKTVAAANFVRATTTNGTVQPTASLTVNGTQSVTVNVGDTVTYNWSSTNANQYSSSYISDSCGSASTWVANTVSGSFSGPIPASEAGCLYTITYTATNTTTGVTANGVVHVGINGTVVTPPATTTPPSVTTAATTPLYRLINSGAMAVLVTTDANEVASAKSVYGYVGGAAIGHVWASQVTGAVPVYRFYSPKAQDFYFTTNPTKPVQYGYTTSGGIAFYVSTSPLTGMVALYDIGNTNGKHTYGLARDINPTNAAAGYKNPVLIGYMLP